jgi:hypothetical protein
MRNGRLVLGSTAYALACIALLACPLPQPPVVPPPGSADSVRYQDVLQKSGHNSYRKKESLFDQLVYHRLRSFELDIWANGTGGYDVHHNDHIDETSCKTLADCLEIMAAFHRAVPQHEVVTIFLEPKAYDGQAQPEHPIDASLDNTLRGSGFPLFTPHDLLIATCPTGGHASTIEEAARRGCFPLTDEMRGKFIFVLMDGVWGYERRALQSYLGNPSKPEDFAVAGTRAAFLSAGIDDSRQNDDYGDFCPGCFAFSGYYPDPPAHLLYTVERSNLAEHGCESGDGGDPHEKWKELAAGGVSHIATDCLNYLHTSWARTHNAAGYPFACPGSNICRDKVEPSDVVGMHVTSGDIEHTADDFGFASAQGGGGEWALRAYLSGPGSSVESAAKGCLMARASLARDSAYVAVCRLAADHNAVRMQLRRTSGGPTEIYDSQVFVDSSATFAQLRAAPGRHGDTPETCFSALASKDGGNWNAILDHNRSPSTCLAGTFPLVGLATSSHGPNAVTMLFGQVLFNEAPWKAIAGTQQPDNTPVGAATARFFHGPTGE